MKYVPLSVLNWSTTSILVPASQVGPSRRAASTPQAAMSMTIAGAILTPT
jgi:hypothetical protein